MPGILEKAGYIITDNPEEDHSAQYKEELKNNPELHKELAIIEHEGWKEFKLLNGWEYNEKRNDDKKQHDCLLPYDQLSEKDQNKDKEAVEKIPDILKDTDLYITKI